MVKFTLQSAITVWITVCPGIVTAHGVSVWAESDRDQVRVEGFFTNGAKVSRASVEVLDCGMHELHSGALDSSGYFKFQPDSRQALRIRVRIDNSHAGEYILLPAQLPPNLPEPTDRVSCDQ